MFIPDRATTVAGSVDKALALLSSFDAQRRRMGLSELARRAGIPKSTAHRLLAVLVEWDLLSRRGTDYLPGPRLAELATLRRRPDREPLREAALPHLLDLYETTHETVHLAVLDDREIVYLEKLHGHNRLNVPSRVGGRFPAASSALGKAMLAFSGPEVVAAAAERLRPLTSHTIVSPRQFRLALDSIRHTGVSFDRHESQVGLVCVAAPVLDWNGKVIAAVSISGPATRFQPAANAAHVRRAAAAIARDVQRAAVDRALDPA